MRVKMSIAVGVSCVALFTIAQAEALSKVHVVKMTNVGGANKFEPSELEIAVGDQVKWVNEGGTHTATSDDFATGKPGNTFNTGTVAKGQDASVNFNAVGTFMYHCGFHKGMNGKITVKK